MKILQINKFLYLKGGDAIATLSTGKLLSSYGHKVVYWGMKHPLNPKYEYEDLFVDNVDFDSKDIINKLKIVSNILYSFEAKRKIEALIKKEKPDIVHLHNFAHQISPSILHVFKKYKIPVVMTMHDYKLVCANYTMFSNGKVCEVCKNGKYYNCFKKKCMKNSRMKSLVSTIEMYLHNNIMHIYDLIDIFISPSLFLKNKLEEMGFKKDIVYIPNFVNFDEFVPKYDFEEKSIVYFGRLSKEKGLFTLIEAVKGMDIKLKIIGDGPIRQELEDTARSWELGVRRNVEFLGYKTGDDLKDEIRKAMFVIVPSEWYENNPMSVVEAFALGKPVIGAKIGGIPELVEDGVRGYLFKSGDINDLREKISLALSDTSKLIEMGKNARRFAAHKLNAERHYDSLSVDVYLKLSYEYLMSYAKNPPKEKIS